MEAFRDISTATARRIDRVMLGMAGCESLGGLEEAFLAEAGKIVPADCLCWNNWQPDWSGPLGFRITAGYSEWFSAHFDIFGEVVGHHPVIATGHFQDSAEQVLRMSDFQGFGRFKDNPLFREVYRHLDSHYQLCYAAGTLPDRRIILTWNRRAFDFTERDRQTFHYLGLRLGSVSRRIDERQRLDTAWHELCTFVDGRLEVGTVRTLGAGDVDLLAELIQGRPVGTIVRERGVRRDSIDKQLGTIRERLGLDNHRQLLSALAELRSGRRAGGG